MGSPPLSTFDTIHQIDLKFGTYNKLHMYFQLSETAWCLIGLHDNNSQINDVIGDLFNNSQINDVTGRPSWIFKFSDFVQIFTFAPQIGGKTALSG